MVSFVLGKEGGFGIVCEQTVYQLHVSVDLAIETLLVAPCRVSSNTLLIPTLHLGEWARRFSARV